MVRHGATKFCRCLVAQRRWNQHTSPIRQRVISRQGQHGCRWTISFGECYVGWIWIWDSPTQERRSSKETNENCTCRKEHDGIYFEVFLFSSRRFWGLQYDNLPSLPGDSDPGSVPAKFTKKKTSTDTAGKSCMASLVFYHPTTAPCGIFCATYPLLVRMLQSSSSALNGLALARSLHGFAHPGVCLNALRWESHLPNPQHDHSWWEKHLIIWQCVKTLYPWWTSK